VADGGAPHARATGAARATLPPACGDVMNTLTETDRRILSALLSERRLPVNTLLRLTTTEGDAAGRHASIHELVSDLEAAGRVSLVRERTVFFSPDDDARPTDPIAASGPTQPSEPQPSEAAQVGTFLPGSGRYRLLSLIGRGGMGEVWLAEDVSLGRNVALKVLLPSWESDPALLQRFVYEARATGLLSHPGVIPVHDVGKLLDGRWFYTMQRIAGRDLQSVLAALAEEDARTVEEFPLPRLLSIFVSVCRTMAYAHDHGFLHRDLKPENILIGSYGEVYVADWGLAKCFDPSIAPGDAGSDPDATLPRGAVLGTAGYMSPEQLSGHHAALDPASDNYALGCILYELLSSRLPFQERSLMALAVRVISESPPDPAAVAPPGREVPWRLSQLALEALDRDARRRPRADQLATRVQAFLDGVEEQRRRALLAEERRQARGLRDAFSASWERLRAQREAEGVERENIALNAPIEQRRALWALQQGVAEAAFAADQLFSRATTAASQSSATVSPTMRTRCSPTSSG
jgi:hypothetical protein